MKRKITKYLCLTFLVIVFFGSLIILSACDSAKKHMCNDGFYNHRFDDNDICHFCGYELKPTSGLEYTLDESEEFYVLTGLGRKSRSSVIIVANTYNDLPVRKIASDVFTNNKRVKCVVLPNNIQTLSAGAFSGCVKLTRISFSSQLRKIPANAFYNCESLQLVVVPHLVEEIGASAFEGCKELSMVEIEGLERRSWVDIGYKAFAGCESLTVFHEGNWYSNIGDFAFAGCGFTDFVVSDMTDTIGIGAFAECKNLKTFQIGISVMSIKDAAFADCYSLEEFTFKSVAGDSVTIQGSLNSIGNGVFDGCMSIKILQIPSAVYEIGNIFAGVYWNNSIVQGFRHEWRRYGYEEFGINRENRYIPSFLQFNEYQGGYYLGNDVNPYVMLVKVDASVSDGSCIHPNARFIGQNAFEGCAIDRRTMDRRDWADMENSETNIIIPDSVISIGDWAFDNCIIKNITIPSTLRYLGYDALDIYSLNYNKFDNALYLGNDTNPHLVLMRAIDRDIATCNVNDKTKFIYGGAFRDCEKLTNVTSAKNVISIGDSAFENCKKLTYLSVPSVTYIGNSAFKHCESLSNVDYFGNATTYLGESAFYGCKSLVEIYIPSILISATISDSVFYGCESLRSVIIPDYIKYIGSFAFRDCKSLISITIPDRVIEIGSFAFLDCESLISITIPDRVIEIGGGAFSSCDKLIEIYNKSALQIAIGEGNGSANSEICDNVKNVYTDEFGQSNLTTTDDGYVFYQDDDECYLMGYVGSETALSLPTDEKWGNYSIYQYAFAYNTKIKSVTIPDSVTSIGYSAFQNCTSLTSITIPDSVTSIDFSAFENCTSLTTITIPDSVTSIGSSAFENCTSLTSITIPDSVTTIGSYAFSDCTSLTSITIPDGVTSIDSSVFYRCTSLTTITIPDSVTLICAEAFSRCTNLTSITIQGTIEQWQAIFKGASWDDYTGSYTIYCTDGTITKDGTVTYYD